MLLPKFPLYSLLNLPAQIIQSYAGECPSNSIYCLALQDQVTKTYNWHKCYKYYRKEDIIGYAKQFQLINMQASAVELRARGDELHCTGKQIFQLDF